MSHQDELKKAAATAALDYVEDDMILGIGTGSTTNYFIDALAGIKHKIAGTVASSKESTERLKSHGITVYELNTVNTLPLYIDGADQINRLLELIKGGGGALTQEKIIASAAEKFICIADETKIEPLFGSFPLPVEVVPMARSFVAREMVKLGGDPVYREGYTTDNGNIILDIHNLKIMEPIKLERAINSIPGVVCNGLFALRPADLLLLATGNGVKTMRPGL